MNSAVEYLGKIKGKWIAVPICIGTQIKGPCSRIDLMKNLAGIDVQAMYPAGGPPKADDWTFDTFLKAAEACHKGGHPFGIGLGTTSDSVDTAGAIFHGFGVCVIVLIPYRLDSNIRCACATLVRLFATRPTACMAICRLPPVMLADLAIVPSRRIRSAPDLPTSKLMLPSGET